MGVQKCNYRESGEMGSGRSMAAGPWPLLLNNIVFPCRATLGPAEQQTQNPWQRQGPRATSQPIRLVPLLGLARGEDAHRSRKPLSVMAEPEASWDDARAGILLEARQTRRKHRMCCAQRYRYRRSALQLHPRRSTRTARRKGAGGRPVWGPAETCSGLGKHGCLGATSKSGIGETVFSPARTSINQHGVTHTEYTRPTAQPGRESHRLRGGLHPVCRGNIGTVRSAWLAQRRQSSQRPSQRFLRLIGRKGTQPSEHSTPHDPLGDLGGVSGKQTSAVPHRGLPPKHGHPSCRSARARLATFFRLDEQFSRGKGEVGFGGFERHPETP